MTKRTQFLFIVALCAIILSGCSSDDNTVVHPVVLQPIEELTHGQEGTTVPVQTDGEFVNYCTSTSDQAFFFNQALHLPAWDGEADKNTSLFNNNEHKNEVYVVRSREELASLYHGSLPLPDIDFNKYTLIFGKTYGNNSSYHLFDVDLWNKDDCYVLDIIVNNYVNDAATMAFVDFFFWKLYPKLDNKEVKYQRTENKLTGQCYQEPLVLSDIEGSWYMAYGSSQYGGLHNISRGEFIVQFRQDGTVVVTSAGNLNFVPSSTYAHAIVQSGTYAYSLEDNKITIGGSVTFFTRLFNGFLIIDDNAALDGPMYYFRRV